MLVYMLSPSFWEGTDEYNIRGDGGYAPMDTPWRAYDPEPGLGGGGVSDAWYSTQPVLRLNTPLAAICRRQRRNNC